MLVLTDVTTSIARACASAFRPAGGVALGFGIGVGQLASCLALWRPRDCHVVRSGPVTVDQSITTPPRSVHYYAPAISPLLRPHRPVKHTSQHTLLPPPPTPSPQPSTHPRTHPLDTPLCLCVRLSPACSAPPALCATQPPHPARPPTRSHLPACRCTQRPAISSSWVHSGCCSLRSYLDCSCRHGRSRC